MTKISVDGKYYDVKPGKNLLESCLALGLNIPHFCYHPALGSVGACRLCAVKRFKDKDDRKGRIVMSCMEPVTDGMLISIEDPEVREFRASVIEGLMTNHPHDCPVCDEGGECHLQDMTIMAGHNYRRYDFPKRTYNDQDLGPFISHEMNRCIQCYRCVRFYREYAGGKDLNVFGSRNQVYFGRYEDGALENEFSGNLVEVCPTGVFTDKTLKNHFTRKWDLTNSPSVCVHCSVGCNIISSERYGSLRRIMSRYNGAVNGYFICDRGRFGYEFVNSQKRIRKAQIRLKKNETPVEIQNDKLLPILKRSVEKNKSILGIGSPRASLESNYALLKLVGEPNFYHGISKKEYRLTKTVLDFFRSSGVYSPSLKQLEKADVILILGEDITNTAPMTALSLRQAVRILPSEEANSKGIPLWNDAAVRELAQDVKSPVYIATPIRDRLDDIAENTIRASYDEISLLGSAIASSLRAEAPVTKMATKELQNLAEKIALSLKNARHPLIISGINCGHEGIIHAAMNVAMALLSKGSDVMLSMVMPECNSLGLGMLPGKSFDDAVTFAAHQEIDTLLILENDLYRRAEAEPVNSLFDRCGQIIVIDHLINETSSLADILIPSGTFTESEGTLVNNEGRAQRYYRSVPDKDQVKAGWHLLTELINLQEDKLPVQWNSIDDIVDLMSNELPVFSKLKNYTPDADFRMLNGKMPRQTMRYSGRTAMNANITVSEPKLPQDTGSPLAFTMEGESERPPSSLVPFYWTPGWNSVQAMYNYLDEPNGSMKGGDPGIRLIERPETPGITYFSINMNSSGAGKDEMTVIPVYRIFGSEELSSASLSVSQRFQEPLVYINQKDADNAGIQEGEMIQFEISGTKDKFKVKIENSLPSGVAGLSVNLPGIPFFDLPGNAKLSKL